MKNLIVAVILLGVFGIGSSFADEQTKNEIKQLYEAKRALHKKLHPIKKRLKVYNNEEVKELKGKACEANKALNDKVNELISVDPEGKKILDELKATENKICEVRKKACQARKAACKMKKGKNK